MTNLPIPLPLPQAPTLADVYRATHRERFTRVPDWWPFGKHFAPETGYADIEDQWWLSFNTNLREMFELFKNSYREYSRSSIFSRWMHEDQFNKDPQVVAAMRGNDFAAWLRATGNVRMNAFESCAWAPTKGARSEEARRNHIASEAAYHKLHDQHKA